MTSTSRALASYVLAACLVRLADEGARVALVLLALQRAGSAGLGGALVAALLIPHAIAAPLVGAAIERAAQPRWLIAAAGAALAAALALTTVLVGVAPASLVVAVLLAAGIGGPALTGGLSAQLGRLLPAGRLPRAFGIDSITYNLAGIAGPALVAALATATGAATATIALATAAALGAVVLATPALRLPPAPGAGAEPDRGRSRDRRRAGSVRATWAALSGDPVLRAVTAASTIGQLGLGALPVVATSLAAAYHQPADAPWLLAATAVGALAGSLAWTAHPAPPRRAPAVVMAALGGLGAMLAAAALAATTTAAVAAFAGAGVFLGPLTGALFTTRHHHAPAPVRAQVFTLSAGIKVSATAAGAALAATLTTTPPTTQLLVAATAPLLAAAAGALALRAATRRARA